MGTTTVMPTLLVANGAQSMTPWSPISTPLLAPSTPATEAQDTGVTVTVAVARTMHSMLTPTCSAPRTGAPSTQTGPSPSPTTRTPSRETSFDFCSDGGYCSKMAQSYGGMVFSASLWGGGGIDMGWLDGMTGCWGECNIGGSSVTFSNFALW